MARSLSAVSGFAVLFSLCFFWSASGVAQAIVEQFKIPMPEIALMPEESFRMQTKEVSEKSGREADLEYSIRIPKGWSRREGENADRFAIAGRILGEIAKFYSPAPAGAGAGGVSEENTGMMRIEEPLSDRSYILMRAGGLAYSMSAHEWFMQYLLANKFNLQGMVEHDERSAEALYVTVDNNVSFAVRGLARVNGNKIIFTEYFVPLEKWEDEKVMQAQVLRSLTMKNDRVAEVEPMLSYKFLDLEEIKYPASWSLRTVPIRSIDRMSLKLFNLGLTIDEMSEKQKLDGRIDIEMVSVYATEDLDAEIDRHRRDVEEQGFVLGRIIESPEDFILNPAFDFAETTVYESNDTASKLIGYEFWITIVSINDYYYFLTLLTPSREADYFLWAKNKRHYKLLIDSIKPRRRAEFEESAQTE